ncbi:MAG: hypothetical protein M1839_005004 [Geoglossum umbratile]|nr:MAG: hypothetical protein M1839_005004 [Geoglossum umbratile]
MATKLTVARYPLPRRTNATGVELTFSGSFLQAVANVLDFFPPTLIGEALEAAINLFRIDLLNRYCCPPDDLAKWTNCNWHGQPGSCFDNHCDIGHQVQLTQSEYGLGQTCWPRLERQRVFCCDPAGGKSPFLPVPLENLFPHPPTGKTVDSVYDLRVDNTWGTGQADTPDEQPNEASFGFVVLTSPETLQISLKKRDGTHWEVFNCNDAVSEEEQTVKMFCTDISESSNCHKITLGHGVPGTILEMPEGCGPSKYAVAKSMVPSAAQSLPKHLEKRDYGHKPVIYDLTFDFDWHRVPRDLGDTQMRVDFSNEIGYWDAIVNKAASKKSKRSLEDAGGNHRRWLEEEWREDVHFGRLSHDELHARWFGSDIIAWLKKFFSPEIKPQFTHNIDSSFTAKLIDETWDCNIKGVDLHAKLLAEALAHVKVATSFGLTIITTLKLPLDLSQSYLYFKNKGDISATFILDAFGKAIFQTGDIELLGLQNFPGATFSIPKLLTVGPNFRLFGAVDAEVTLSAHLESKVQIASWEVQQTYPDQGPDWDPKAVSPPDRTGTGSFDGLTQPSFDYSVTATGQITAHLKPTFEFGITFDQIWGVGAAKADVVADGWVRFMGAAGIGSSGNCPFTYGIDVGADLYAKVEAPPAFGWNPRTFPIASISPKSAKPGGSCPAQRKRNTFEISASPQIGTETMNNNRPAHHLLGKRAPTVGPLISLPKSCFFCPGAPVGGAACETIEGWEPNEINQPDLTSKRDLSGDTHYNIFEKRAKKTIDFCQARPASLSAKMQMVSPPYDSSGVIVGKLPNIATYGYTNPTDCNDYGFGLVAKPVPKVNTNKFATEHILEYQLLSIFFDETRNQEGSVFNDLRPSAPGTLPQIVNLCQYLKSYFDLPVPLWPNIGGVTRSPIQWLSYQYPGSDNAFTEEFVILDKGVNNAKEKMWGSDRISADSKMQEYLRGNPEKAAKNVKDVLSAYKYHQFPDVNTILVAQAMRIANMLENLDNNLLPPIHRADSNGNLYSPYRPIGLRNLWMNWIRGRTEAARIKAETHMRDVVSKLQAGYATPELRNSATPQEQEFITRIDSLATAVNAALANPWFNPF